LVYTFSGTGDDTDRPSLSYESARNVPICNGYGELANDNGATAITQVEKGDWTSSCLNGTYATDGVSFSANCSNKKGQTVNSSINPSGCGGDKNIVNSNGILMCDSDSQPTILGGKWTDSCGYAKYDPSTGVLSALCDGGGNNITSISVGSCQGFGGAYNDQGVLNCSSIIGGDWVNSCDAVNSSFSTNNGHLILKASCKDESGAYQTSEIYADTCGGKYKVTNHNGVLMCDSDSKPNILGGSWVNNCGHAKYDPSTGWLSAFCDGGGNNMTSISVGSCKGLGAHNDHGVLACYSLPSGDWTNSCDGAAASFVAVNNAANHTILHASCRDATGVFQASEIYVDECSGQHNVTSHNGVLMCESDSKPSNVLNGNWAAGCAYEKYDPSSGVLSAFCGGVGDYMNSVNVSSCGGRGASSDGGVLHCN